MELAIRYKDHFTVYGDPRLPRVRSTCHYAWKKTKQFEYKDQNNRKHTVTIRKSKYGQYILIKGRRIYLIVRRQYDFANNKYF